MASLRDPACTCPARENRARIPAEPPYPTPGRRTKLPFMASYSKYELSPSFSKSSPQIHPGLGVSHSAVPLGAVEGTDATSVGAHPVPASATTAATASPI